MIKVFCDWCKRETTEDYLAGALGRRVAMTENGKLNVCVNLEFSESDRPEHVCIVCFCDKLTEAAHRLRTGVPNVHG